jgi:hypothetical protein
MEFREIIEIIIAFLGFFGLGGYLSFKLIFKNKKLNQNAKIINQSGRDTIYNYYYNYNNDLQTIKHNIEVGNNSESIKKEIEKLFWAIGHIHSKFYRETSIIHFSNAKINLAINQMEEHFFNLLIYFLELQNNKINLGKIELSNLGYLLDIVEIYKPEYYKTTNFHSFLHSLKEFEKYCKDEKKQEHLNLVKEVFEKLEYIYNKDKIIEAIKKVDDRLKDLNLK